MACSLHTETAMNLEHINPPELHLNPAYSHAVRVHGPHETLFIGGQNAVSRDGAITGVGDVAAQATQVARNLRVVLKQAGASPRHVVRWGIHLVQGQDPGAAMEAFQRELGVFTPAPTVTVLFVSALAHPQFLLEVDATAVIPADA